MRRRPKALILFGYCNRFAVSEKQADKPKTADRYECINNSADYFALSAEYPCDYIKTEKTDGAPVDGADYYKKQCDSVDYHFKYLLAVILRRFPANIH